MPSDPARSGDWERFGIPGHALESSEYARARAELIRRVGALCAVRESALAQG
jgi:hypothetical protein